MRFFCKHMLFHHYGFFFVTDTSHLYQRPPNPVYLPRPPPKAESLNEKKPLDLNLQCGPVVLSPPRKARRVMVNHVGFEADSQNVGKGGGNDKEHRVGESGLSSHIPCPWIWRPCLVTQLHDQKLNRESSSHFYGRSKAPLDAGC
ncbi:Cyclin-dependent kinase D-1 [Platanthera guangdongensis]|uniref:Cyclin-dependent kinase D-1 n=1 Tax=Platanthera guangdongensis TaxID=2320717 RepID=A0ABR2MJF7_9ASPA